MCEHVFTLALELPPRRPLTVPQARHGATLLMEWCAHCGSVRLRGFKGFKDDVWHLPIAQMPEARADELRARFAKVERAIINPPEEPTP